MAKYFIDCEFFEGFNRPLFGKTRHFIDLISIGIVADDGRKFYAISNEFDLEQVWYNEDTWVKDNVLKSIYEELHREEYRKKVHHFSLYPDFSYKSMKRFIKWNGKSNKEIADEIFRFVHYPVYKKWDDKFSFIEEIVKSAYDQGEEKHEFYGYYSDYDHVLLSSLFGKMINLPVGFPMYCIDLKQTLDEKVNNLKAIPNNIPEKFESVKNKDISKWTFDEKLEIIKSMDAYPKNYNDHNALSDACWNKQLYEFLKTI